MSALKKISAASITSPKGFIAWGMNAGIKKNKLDTCLIVSKKAAVAAATFTRNTAKAWPVLLSQKHISSAQHRAIFATSGNANCYNGEQGRQAVEECVTFLAQNLKIKKEQILVAQTGIIGREFPAGKVKAAIPALVENMGVEGGQKAAQGILTTDTCTKEIAYSFKLGESEVRMAAIAKGSGMMNPNMATMLCFITTDAAIAKSMLKKALKEAVYETFNEVSIDTDTSTNDTVFILANGAAGNTPIKKEGESYQLFLEALKEICRNVAKELVRDGEGVKRLCDIHVTGARSRKDAQKIAQRIAHSMLFKTMLAGGDPNWGRVVAAVGATEIPFDPKKLDISFEGIKILNHGKVMLSKRPLLRQKMQHKEIYLEVNLNLGSHEAKYLTCDLTTAYVRINAWLTS